MSHALDMLLEAKPIQHRPEIPEGWSLCSVCGSIRASDYHVELPDGWEPIATAPRNATWIQVLMTDGTEQRAHWAQDLSGEEQPAFRGWFVKAGSVDPYMRQIGEPIGWKPLPTI